VFAEFARDIMKARTEYFLDNIASDPPERVLCGKQV